MYQDLHLHFTPTGGPAQARWTVRLEGIERTDEAGPVRLEAELVAGDLIARGTQLLERCRAAFGGGEVAVAARLRGVADAVRELAQDLERALGNGGRLLRELAPYAASHNVRLWMHLDRAPELQVLPWEALFLGDRWVVERGGWQVLRAGPSRQPRPPGVLAKALVLVCDVTQDADARQAATSAFETVQTLRKGLLGIGAACEIGVVSASFRPLEQAWDEFPRAVLVDVAGIARWIAAHPDADLFIALGHALAEAPAGPVLLQGANALGIGPPAALRECRTLPVVRVLERDLRPTLADMLRPTQVRLAALFGCETNERMARVLAAAVDHVVGLRATIPPKLADLAAEVLLAGLISSDSVGAAVRRMRQALGTLDVAHDASDQIRPLWWAPAHWCDVGTDEPFRDELAETLHRFRRAQREHLDQLEGELAPHGRTLEQIAVTLHVDEHAPLEDESRAAAEKPRTSHVPEARLSTLERLVVQATASGFRALPGAWVVRGDPGSGKTTSVRDLARRLSTGSLGVTAVYVSLASLSKSEEFGKALVYLPKHPPAKAEPHQFALELLLCQFKSDLPPALRREHVRKRLVLLLDGLDEVVQRRADILVLIQELRRELPSAALVVTTRTEDYQPFASKYKDQPQDFRNARLEPLDPTQQRELLARWYRAAGKTEEDPHTRADRYLDQISRGGHSLRELARIPLFLNLMGQMLEARRALGGALRHKFLHEAIDFLLLGEHKPEALRRPLKPPGMTEPDVEPGRSVLRAVALRMSELRTTKIDYQEILSWFASAPKAVKDEVRRWSSAEAFLEAARATGVLRPVLRTEPEGEWEFWHRAFQESLTAEALHREVLAARGLETLWRRVMALLAPAKGKSAEAATPIDFWREPFALLAGYLRAEQVDAWIDGLLARPATRRVGLAGVATADALAPEVTARALDACTKWEESQLVYAHLGARLGQGARVLQVLRARGLTLASAMKRDAERGIRIELHFLVECLAGLAGGKEAAAEARAALGAVLSAIGAPAGLVEAFTRIPGQRTELWAPVPAGTFTMGSPETEEGRLGNEEQVEVTLGSAFWIARVPVTLGQYRLFDPRKEHHWGEDGLLPVTEVSWYESALFCRWLEHHGAALKQALGAAGAELCFRLPTEAEWEYCCRDAGTRTTRFVSGDSEGDLARVGVFGKGWEAGPERVGSKAAAGDLGLHDMHGNVWEWCGDWYADRPRGGRDPAGPPAGARRVRRGGSYGDDAQRCRSACRDWGDPVLDFDYNYGFRVVLAPSRPLLGDR